MSSFSDYVRLLKRITDWLIDPSQINEDGLESPSGESSCSAITLVTTFYRDKKGMPGRVVENGEGGVSMEYFNGDKITEYSIGKDGSIEKLGFESSRLVSRDDVVLGEVAAV